MTPQAHCDHECVCCDYPDDIVPKQRCPRKDCPHDTRTYPAPSPECTVKVCKSVMDAQRAEAAAQAREDVLEKLRMAIGERTWIDSDGDLHEGALTIQEIEESLRTGGEPR